MDSPFVLVPLVLLLLFFARETGVMWSMYWNGWKPRGRGRGSVLIWLAARFLRRKDEN